ncbi:MAG: hypothetical protein ABJF23_27190 [Bryobacteraceae bacterium]
MFEFEYAPPAQRPHLWYVNTNKVDVFTNLAGAGRDWCHLAYNLSTEGDFMKSNSHFMVYGRPKNFATFLLSRKNILGHSSKSQFRYRTDDYVLAEISLNQ